MKRQETLICGLAAVRARFERDAGSIQRLFFDEPTSRKVGVISKALASARKVYRCVDATELERIAGTVHHGGIVAVVHDPSPRVPSALEIQAWARRRAPLVLLDRIGNPHNLGAIARTAAFFGVGQIVIPDSPQAAAPSEAAYRVAEGGLEHAMVWRVPRLAAFVGDLRGAGYTVVGAATRGGHPRVASMQDRPLALVLGNEESGLSAEVADACSALVTLSGAGKVESLNVSVAAAILLWELIGRLR